MPQGGTGSESVEKMEDAASVYGGAGNHERKTREERRMLRGESIQNMEACTGRCHLYVSVMHIGCSRDNFSRGNFSRGNSSRDNFGRDNFGRDDSSRDNFSRNSCSRADLHGASHNRRDIRRKFPRQYF